MMKMEFYFHLEMFREILSHFNKKYSQIYAKDITA